MVVESIMFFALGFLGAGLIALALGSALWNRAVRLTRRRIEAATPVTLNEFRADKDKLRAVHAVEVRKLELRNDMLRDKLAALVRIIDGKTTEIDALKAERDEQFAAIETLQAREAELVERIRDLERDSAALAARVRQSEDDFAVVGMPAPPVQSISEGQLSGDYRADVEDLLIALNIERQRNAYLEDQARMLLVRLEKKKSGALKDEAVSVLRDALAANSDPESKARLNLHTAETRISSAETRLAALLTETSPSADRDSASDTHLAEEFLREERLGALKAQVLGFEKAVISDELQTDDAGLRAMLEAIALEVSLVIYEEDSGGETNAEESLFDRVLKFSNESIDGAALQSSETSSGRVSERMAALRDIQVR